MLIHIDDKNIMPIYDAREKYCGSKAVFVVTDMSDMSEIQGCVCAISSDSDSYSELCEFNNKLKSEGIQTIIIGSYENGGSIGVQYEVFKW